jgi:hypothetical protein
MTVNQPVPSVPAHRTHPRTVLTVTGVTGIGYALSWAAGLSLPAPNPALNATGSSIVTAFTGHEAAGALNFVLTEGLPAVGIAVVSLALARATGGTRGRVLRTAGLVATVISLAEFALGLFLTRAADPSTAHLLWSTIDRIDGIKMFAFAVLGAAAYRAAVLPRWLRYAGAGLAVTMTVSGLVYLTLAQSLSVAAGPALLFLLVLITGAGIVLGAKAVRN